MQLTNTNITQRIAIIFIILITVFLFVQGFTSSASAQEHEEMTVAEEMPTNLAESIRAKSVKVAIAAAIILVLLTIITLLFEAQSEPMKQILFWLMAAAAFIPTVYFIGSTIYLNNISETGGPVHWHADFRIFACGEELLAPTPEGFLSNKTGTAILHEHEDRRIHVEGTLPSTKDASLENFFRVQGGTLTQNSFTVPTREGLQSFQDGDRCPDGTVGAWNVFLYKTEGMAVTQTKLHNAPTYVLSPEVNVPPGDCIIFEFGPQKTRTEQICNFYAVEIEKGNLNLIR